MSLASSTSPVDSSPEAAARRTSPPAAGSPPPIIAKFKLTQTYTPQSDRPVSHAPAPRIPRTPLKSPLSPPRTDRTLSSSTSPTLPGEAK